MPQGAVRSAVRQGLEQVGVGERVCPPVLYGLVNPRLGTSHGPPTVRARAFLPFETTPIRR